MKTTGFFADGSKPIYLLVKMHDLSTQACRSDA
jgi:hypothetical protein